MEVAADGVQWRVFMSTIYNFISSKMNWGVSNLATSVVHCVVLWTTGGSVKEWAMS
jgi:hypothetical protein